MSRTVAGASTPLDDMAEPLHMEAPLPCRETEYETVIAFIADRISLKFSGVLFVCGGCGCGKTSTVKRALRAMSEKQLPCDVTSRSFMKQTSLEERGWCLVDKYLDNAAVKTALKRETEDMDLESNDGDNNDTVASRQSQRLETTPLLRPTSLPFTPTPRWSGCSDDSTESGASAAHTLGKKRLRSEPADEPQMPDLPPCRSPVLAATAAPSPSSSGGSHPRRDAQLRFPLVFLQERYPEVFVLLSRMGRPLVKRPPHAKRMLSHYVNCADVNSQQLVEAVAMSIQAVCSRTDGATAALLKRIRELPEQASSQRRGGAADWRYDYSSTSSNTVGGDGASRRAMGTSRSANTPLHIVALDEVEYLRPGARATLTKLAELSFAHPAQLALVMISNQRYFVHVPQMFLRQLAFEAYTVEQLSDIGAAATAVELQRYEATTDQQQQQQRPCRLAASRKPFGQQYRLTARDIVIGDKLYGYMARKVLFDFSGDVRQVLAMSRCIASTAWRELMDQAATLQCEVKKGAGRSTTAATPPTVRAEGPTAVSPSTLEAVVDTFCPATPTATTPSLQGGAKESPRNSAANARVSGAAGGSGAQSGSSSARSSGSHEAAVGQHGGRAVPSRAVMTLAKSARVLSTNQIDSDIHKHIGGMPEQMLYVLSCLVVLTLGNQKERNLALSAIGGSSGGAGGSAVRGRSSHDALPTTSLKLRAVHQLYTSLMMEHHFPAMNAAGVTQAVDGLADIGILTRPQRRGNEEVFSFNGAWTLAAMEAALTARGEMIRAERLSCGLSATENKFEVVLRELKKMVAV